MVGRKGWVEGEIQQRGRHMVVGGRWKEKGEREPWSSNCKLCSEGERAGMWLSVGMKML